MLLERQFFSYFLLTIFCLSTVTSVRLHFPTPPNFPSHIPLRIGDYENWANQLSVRYLWFATPSFELDVVTLANWAYANNYTLRASGCQHNWSPLTVTIDNENLKNVVLVELKEHLTRMEIVPSIYPDTKAVKVGAGAKMLNLLTFLEYNGLGVYAAPAPGDLTIGGVLAIGGHGTSVPATNEEEPPGYSYGTISNLVISLTAVVWDEARSAYVLKKFIRSDPETKAFLVNLGRTIITEVTLMVGPNYNLRCQSRSDILSSELFAKPANVKIDSRTFSHFLDQTGRVETILFPFSNTPWLKAWSICPIKPSGLVKTVTRPYNYLITNIFPEFLSLIVGNVTNGLGFLNPILGPTQSLLATTSNALTLSFDLWGKSKNLLLYVKPTTLRQTACGYAVITARDNVQEVVSRLVEFYNGLLREYSARNEYPVNGVIEIRASGLDHNGGVVPDGESPLLSAVRSVEGRPELDTAVWVSVLSFDDAPQQHKAFKRIEEFFFDEIDGEDAVVRVEWSKGWAYSEQNAWSNPEVYGSEVQSKFGDGWKLAASVFDKYDPKRIFTNAFLDKLFAEV